MNREQQVVSLELSKKLRELGVNQESYFYWKKTPFEDYTLSTDVYKEQDYYSAFTVAELGKMFGNRKMILSGYVHKLGGFSCKYFYGSGVLKHFEADTEADARALMLIYLLEHKAH